MLKCGVKVTFYGREIWWMLGERNLNKTLLRNSLYINLTRYASYFNSHSVNYFEALIPLSEIHSVYY